MRLSRRIPFMLVALAMALTVIFGAPPRDSSSAVSGVARAAAIVPGKFFHDEDQAAWAKGFIRVANLRGFLKGDPDGRFRPNDPVKREELVAALVRFVGLEEAAASQTDSVLHFQDSDEVLRRAPWARGYVAVAQNVGILPQDEGRFACRASS